VRNVLQAKELVAVKLETVMADSHGLVFGGHVVVVQTLAASQRCPVLKVTESTC
jgi:acetyl-CoA carboxylase carboxyltransferase component